MPLRLSLSQVVVVHTYNPSIWESEADRSEFEASPVYRATQRNSVLRKQTNKQKNKNKKRKRLSSKIEIKAQAWWYTPVYFPH